MWIVGSVRCVYVTDYAKGHATLKGAPAINHKTLITKGFTNDDLVKVESGLAAAFEISFAFNHWVLGD